MPAQSCGFGPRSPYPTKALQNAAFANLDLWVRRGVEPPPGLLLNFLSDGTQVLDTYGNPTGGVRTPYVDVPTAQWFSASTGPGLCYLIGYDQPFAETQLETLYPNKEAYLKLVLADTAQLVEQRYITPEDGLKIIQEARQSTVPAAADIPSDLPDDIYQYFWWF